MVLNLLLAKGCILRVEKLDLEGREDHLRWGHVITVWTKEENRCSLLLE